MTGSQRVDRYVRFSLYGNFVAIPPLVLLAAVPWSAVVLVSAQAALCVLLVRGGLDHYLGLTGRPTRLIVATGAVTAGAVAAGYLAYHPGQAGPLLVILVASYVAALSTAVRPRIALTVGAVGCLAATALRAPALGLAAVCLVAVLAFRLTAWILRVVWELDRARHDQADLAVAQERLRFARDLHDVVGRTLSVVALKAELAARLARLGRAEAVEEMLEVRRIAQESLTEMRAVVGGYRAADLDVELTGARALLSSAGIGCRVVGDGSGAGLPEPVQGVLAWVVREGTTNVLRHSTARDCAIVLRPAADGTGPVTLTIENDGVSGDPGVRYGGGLIGLTERVTGHGGTVVAERRGDVFRLTATLPLNRATATAATTTTPTAATTAATTTTITTTTTTAATATATTTATAVAE